MLSSTGSLTQSKRVSHAPPPLTLSPTENKNQEPLSSKTQNQKICPSEHSDGIVKRVEAHFTNQQCEQALALCLAYLKSEHQMREDAEIRNLELDEAHSHGVMSLSLLIQEFDSQIRKIPELQCQSLKELIPLIFKSCVNELAQIEENAERTASALALNHTIFHWIEKSSNLSLSGILNPMLNLFSTCVRTSPSITPEQFLEFDPTFTILTKKSKEIELPLRAVRTIRDNFTNLQPIGVYLLNFCEQRTFQALKVSESLDYRVMLEYSGLLRICSIPRNQLNKYVDSLLQRLFSLKPSRIKSILEAVLLLRFFPRLRSNPLSHDLSTLLVGLQYFENVSSIFGTHISEAEEALFSLFLEELVVCASLAWKQMRDTVCSKLVLNLCCIGMVSYRALLKMQICSTTVKCRVSASGRRIAEMLLNLMVCHFEAFSFPQRNKALEQIAQTSVDFLRDIPAHQIAHFSLILSKLEQYGLKSTGKGHMKQFVRIARALLTHLDAFLSNPLHLKFKTQLSRICSLLRKVLFQFQQVRSSDSEDLVLTLESILEKIMRFPTLGECPTLFDLSNLFAIEHYFQPKGRDVQSDAQFSTVFSKTRQFYHETQASAKSFEQLGSACLLYSLSPLLNAPRTRSNCSSFLQRIQAYDEPSQVLLYSLPVLADPSAESSDDFQAAIEVTKQEILGFIDTHFAHQSVAQSEEVPPSYKYTAALSLFNSRRLSEQAQFSLLQLTTELVHVSALSFLPLHQFHAPETQYKSKLCRQFAIHLVYPYLANTKYAFSIKRSSTLIPQIVNGIESLNLERAAESHTARHPQHYLVAALLCYQIGVKYEIGLESLRKVQELVPKLVNHYYSRGKQKLKLFIRSYFELSKSRFGFQEAETAPLAQLIKRQFKKIQTAEEAILSLRCQVNYAWLLVNRKEYKEACSYFLELYGQEIYIALLSQELPRDPQSKPGILSLQDSPSVSLLQILKCLLLVSYFRTYFMREKHYRLYNCLLRNLVPTLKQRLVKSLTSFSVESIMFSSYHKAFLREGFALTEDQILKFCYSLQDSASSVRSVLSKVMGEVCEIGEEIGDIGLAIYYQFEKCNLDRSLSLSSAHESTMKLVSIDRARTQTDSFRFPLKTTFDNSTEYDIAFALLAHQFSALNQRLKSQASYNIGQFRTLINAIFSQPSLYADMPSPQSALELLLSLPVYHFSHYNKIRLFSHQNLQLLIAQEFPEFATNLRKGQIPQFKISKQLPNRIISHSSFMQSLSHISKTTETPFKFIDDVVTIKSLLSCLGSKVSHYYKGFNPDLAMFPFDTSAISLPPDTSLVALVLDKQNDAFFLFKYYSSQQCFMLTLNIAGIAESLTELESKLFSFEHTAHTQSPAKSIEPLQRALAYLSSEVEPALYPLIPLLLPRPSNPKTLKLLNQKARALSHKIPTSPLLLQSILTALLGYRISEETVGPVLNFYGSQFPQTDGFQDLILGAAAELVSVMSEPVRFGNLLLIPDYTVTNFQFQYLEFMRGLSVTRLPSCSFLSSTSSKTLNLTRGAMFADESVDSAQSMRKLFDELNWPASLVHSSSLVHNIKNVLKSDEMPEIIVYGGHGASCHPIEFGEEFQEIARIKSAIVLLSCHPLYYKDCGAQEGFSHGYNYLLKQCPLVVGAISAVYSPQADLYLERLKEELLAGKEKEEAGAIFERVKENSEVGNYPPVMMGLPVLHDPFK